MEKDSNGGVEETREEEAVEVMEEVFEELKSKVPRVEEGELGSVSDPVEVVSSGVTEEAEIPVEDGSGDTNVVEEEGKEIKDKIFEFTSNGSESEEKKERVEETEVQALDWSVPETAQTSEFADKEAGSVEKKEAQETEVQALDSIAETSGFADKEVFEEKEDDSMNPPAGSAENVNKDEISTETARNLPVTSVADRASWRNCCGLFEVLRRNK